VIHLAHVADLHVDERGRLEDVVEVLRAFVDRITEEAVDLVLVAGDCFERRSTPAERAVLADFLQAAADVAPVVVAKGNHDQGGDLELFARLETARPLLVFERPTAAPGSAPILELAGGRRLGILALPWFDKANLAAGLEATVDAEATRELTIAAARELLVAIGAEVSRVRGAGAVPVLVAHVLVGGSEVSTGQVLLGTTVELAPFDLAETGAAYVALGHVHAAQAWLGGRVAYAGSPHRANYGEPEAKGWRLVTLSDEGEFLSNEFRELPARRIELLEVDWSDEAGAAKLRAQGIGVAFALGERDRVRGARVRFRARVCAQDLAHVDAAAIERVLLADGAAEVKVEVLVVAETRARAPEIVRATSTAEKLQAWLGAKGIPVDEAARARLLGKLAQLEGGEEAARAAA
jgi:exonuclease SbcD